MLLIRKWTVMRPKYHRIMLPSCRCLSGNHLQQRRLLSQRTRTIVLMPQTSWCLWKVVLSFISSECKLTPSRLRQKYLVTGYGCLFSFVSLLRVTNVPLVPFRMLIQSMWSSQRGRSSYMLTPPWANTYCCHFLNTKPLANIRTSLVCTIWVRS